MSSWTQASNDSTAPLGPVNPDDRVTKFHAPLFGDNVWIEYLDSQQTIGAPIENVTVLEAFYPENTAKKTGVTGVFTLSPGDWELQHHDGLGNSQVTFRKLGTSIRQEFSAAGFQSRDIAYVTVATQTQAIEVPLAKGGDAFHFKVLDPSKPPEGQDTVFGRMTYQGNTVNASLWGCCLFGMKEKVDIELIPPGPCDLVIVILRNSKTLLEMRHVFCESVANYHSTCSDSPFFRIRHWSLKLVHGCIVPAMDFLVSDGPIIGPELRDSIESIL